MAFFVKIMIKFKKHYNLILIFTMIGVFLCQDAAYPKDTLRLQIGTQGVLQRIKEITTTLGPMNIEIVPPEQYAEYEILLRKISSGLKDIFTYNTYRSFEIIANSVGVAMLNPEDSKILALFVVKNSKEEIVGAKVVLKPRYYSIIRSKAVSGGQDAVRHSYQGNHIGRGLRKAAIEWVMQQGYPTYVESIRDQNTISIRSFKNACTELGLRYRYISRISSSDWVSPSHYVVDLEERHELPDVITSDANNSL